MTELSATILELCFFQVNLLLKIVNSCMKNISKIIERINWNLTRFHGDEHFPPIQLKDIKHLFQSSLLIVIPFTSQTFRVYYFVLSTCIFSLLLYFCDHPWLGIRFSDTWCITLIYNNNYYYMYYLGNSLYHSLGSGSC